MRRDRGRRRPSLWRQVKRHRRRRKQSLCLFIDTFLLALVDWRRRWDVFVLGLMHLGLRGNRFLVEDNRARSVLRLLFFGVGAVGRFGLNLLETLGDALGYTGSPLWVPVIARMYTRRGCVVVGDILVGSEFGTTGACQRALRSKACVTHSSSASSARLTLAKYWCFILSTLSSML